MSESINQSGTNNCSVDMRAIGAVPPYAPYATMGKHAERARQ